MFLIDPLRKIFDYDPIGVETYKKDQANNKPYIHKDIFEIQVIGCVDREDSHI